jgi:hypothetical protein
VDERALAGAVLVVFQCRQRQRTIAHHEGSRSAAYARVTSEVAFG